MNRLPSLSHRPTWHPSGSPKPFLAPGCLAVPENPVRIKTHRLVQLRLRLWLVPVRPRSDVLELRLEEVVQELLLRVLHLREDLARGRRADPVHGVRVHRPLPVDGHEVCDLLRPGEELPLLVREVELSHPLCVRVPNSPRGPSEDRQEAGLALHTFRVVRHLADPHLLVEIPALEAEEVNRLGR